LRRYETAPPLFPSQVAPQGDPQEIGNVENGQSVVPPLFDFELVLIEIEIRV